MKLPMRFRDFLIAFISVLVFLPSGTNGKICNDPNGCDPTSPAPAPAPVPTTGHYVAIGNTQQSGKIEDDVDYYCQPDDSNQAVYQSTKHGYDIAVSCCTDGEQIVPDNHPGADQINFQRDGWRYKPSGSNSKCNNGNAAGNHPKTYQEAVDLCDAAGYRLCTLEEMIEDKLTKGKGCWYDAAYNWVSDECADPVTEAAIAVSGNSATEAANADDNATFVWMEVVFGVSIPIVLGAAVLLAVCLVKRKRVTKPAEAEMTQVIAEEKRAAVQHLPEPSLTDCVVVTEDGVGAATTTDAGNTESV